jgi:hypothetical protein
MLKKMEEMKVQNDAEEAEHRNFDAASSPINGIMTKMNGSITKNYCSYKPSKLEQEMNDHIEKHKRV